MAGKSESPNGSSSDTPNNHHLLGVLEIGGLVKDSSSAEDSDSRGSDDHILRKIQS